MKRKVILLVSTFLVWALIFVLQKPIFLLAYGGFSHVLAVVWHGLPLDFSMAGYLTAIPGLVLLAGAIPLRVMHSRKASNILMGIVRAWIVFASIVVSLAFIANLALYGYWRFPLDSTPIFFLASSPSAALASIAWWQGLLGLLGIAVVSVFISLMFHLLWTRYGRDVFKETSSAFEWLPVLILDALLFLPIRGGVTVSTMNTGKAYFSQDQTLNHAAVNPLFSFMESMAHQEDFGSQYRFMDDDEAHRLFRNLSTATDSLNSKNSRHGSILKQTRPDIYIVILESFSDTLTRVPGVTPNLNSLKKEGVYFSHFYANGFRTDRGLVSILLGYPSPGAISLMKYPRKTANLPSIAQHLVHAGYDSHYYYGGDADFTNMRSFLMNQGFRDVIEDVDFPVSERLSKWGVPDHLLFQRAQKDISQRQTSRKPLFTVIQTSSSHEPFDVPYHKLNDKILNAFAYADSCIGGFIKFMKTTKRWDNSLVIFIPDHLGAWPENADNFASWRFHVPMIWVGGAVKEPLVVDTYGSQQDIAATLLGQLNIRHGDMPFSKDLFSDAIKHYAYFMPNDGFGMITDDNEIIFDNKQQKVIIDKGKQKGKNLKYGKAILQVLFDDIEKR